MKYLAPDGSRHSTYPGQKASKEVAEIPKAQPTPVAKTTATKAPEVGGPQSCSPPTLKEADKSFEAVEKAAYDSPALAKQQSDVEIVHVRKLTLSATTSHTL